jgi:transcriptional regulator with XRE-family HTH domain
MRLLRLKFALFQKQISQAQLAREIGRTPAHVSRIVRGRVKPRARDRRRISSFLGISEAQLFPSLKRTTRSTLRSKSDRACGKGR